MNIVVYDGTFEGLMTAVFEIYEYKIMQPNIVNSNTASGSLFGATGSSNFLSKSTGVAAAIFFGATLALAFLGNRPVAGSGGVIQYINKTRVALTVNLF